MKRRMLAATAQTFRSLSVRDFRLYWAGMSVSMCGTWMQYVAQDWLIIDLGGKGAALGMVTGLQFLPYLVAGLWGGAVADRVDKRKLLVGTQTALAVLAVTLGVLTLLDVVAIWMVFACALAVGCVSVLDVPARHALVGEIVPTEHLPNAVALNGLVFNGARIVGPALAAVTISAVGVAAAFLLNAASYMGSLLALGAITSHSVPGRASTPRRGQVRDGIRYVWQAPVLRFVLLLMAAVSLFGLNHRVLLPVIARYAFDGGPGTYGALTVVMAVGAVGATLGMAATRAMPTRRWIVAWSGVFGVLSMAAAVMPTLATMMVMLLLTGAAGITFLSATNSLLQLESEPEMRGRVVSVYALMFVGINPVGAPLIGWFSERWGARAAMFGGGVVTTAAALAAALVLLRARREAPATTDVAPLDTSRAREPAVIGAGGA